jgi:hypothetical protein
MFSTIRGICFSLNANPNAMKTLDSCTLPSTVGRLLLGLGVENLIPSAQSVHYETVSLQGSLQLGYLPKNVIIAPAEPLDSAWA